MPIIFSKKIYLLIFIIIIIIITIFYFNHKKINTEYINTEKKQTEIPIVNQGIEKIKDIKKIKDIEKIKQKYSSIKNQNKQKIKINNEIYTLALENNDKELCLFMNNSKSIDICTKHVAVKIFDINLCDDISTQKEKDNCFNQINLAKAENNKNILLCDQITDKMMQLTCMERIINQGIIIDDCQQIPLYYSPRTMENIQEIELRDLCISKVLYKQAVDDNNKILCEKIPLRDTMAECLGKLKSIPLSSDYDNDGLNYRHEIIYGTDPNIPDTDGDGFLDSDEVKNGYNPTGKGELLF